MNAPSSSQPISNQHSTGQIVVTQVRSAIGAKPKARGALRALGLGKIGRSHALPDRPEIRGMLRKVSHLITVENVAGESTAGEDVTDQEVSNAETA